MFYSNFNTFNDISQSGISLNSAEGDYKLSSPVSLGFPFPFFGNNYNSIRVASDGYITFDMIVNVNDTGTSNGKIPSNDLPNNIIAVYWHDLDVAFLGSSEVHYQLFTNTSPNRIVVQWSNFDFWNQNQAFADATLTFQVTLYETGMIVMSYNAMIANDPANQDNATCGTSADHGTTIGLENSNGTQSITYCYNQAGMIASYSTLEFQGIGP